MTKPPIKKPNQKHYTHSAVRLPPELNEEIKLAAEHNGRSMNAEIIARLQASPLDTVLAEMADLKRMMRTLLDQS